VKKIQIYITSRLYAATSRKLRHTGQRRQCS